MAKKDGEIVCKHCSGLITDAVSMIGQYFYHKKCFQKLQGEEVTKMPKDVCYSCGDKYLGDRVIGNEALCDRCFSQKISQAEKMNSNVDEFPDVAKENTQGLIKKDLLRSDE